MTSGWRSALEQGLGASYQIRQELGGGGMSATFIAEETALGRSVVLKVLSPELTAGLNAERFEREIHLAARLQHAFIVPLLAAGIADGQPWYTMPLVQGESLRARIAREGALTPNATARILRDVAEALAYAHAQGVVHRDIKPDNILLSGAHALVADFGVAKAVSASTTGGGRAGVTGTGIAIGTLAYMSPEQAAADPQTDHRSDLYALGATAYEMLTGRPLFGQRSPAQMLVAHATERPESLTKIAPSVPNELAALVDRLLAKHPNDRPAHAQDVADALAGMLTRWTSGEMPPTRTITFGRALALWSAAFVGVVGAAWLAVRWLPIPEWTLPAAIVVMLAGLPVLVLTAWLHRPAKPIAPMPSVSSTTTVGKIKAVARPHLTWNRAARGGGIAVGALALVAAAWAGSRALGVGPAATLRSEGRIAPTDRVFVAEFDSPTSDTGLGGVVTDLIRTELGRSASLQLISPNERAATLTAMGRPATTRVGSNLAREFSARANAKVYLSGAVTQLGSGYLLRAGLMETSSGSELAAFRESARSADDIIKAVDHLGRELRDRLGASLREVRSAPPLSWSVTPSLEAARLYTEGIALASAADQSAGLRLLERAVQVDTEFAMAYRRMASYYDNVGNPDRSAWAAERAFRFRAKLPAAMQRTVEGSYYSSAGAYDLDKSDAAYEARLETFGPDGPTLNNVALHYAEKRDFERSLETFRSAIKLDSTSAFAPISILGAMWATGRKEEARQYIEKNLTRWLNPVVLITPRSELASAELNVDSAARIIEAGLREPYRPTPNQRAALDLMLAPRQRAQGRLAAATQSIEEAVKVNPASDTVGKIAPSVLYRAQMRAWDEERPAEARHLLDSVSAANPPGNATPLAYHWTELATEYALAGDPAKARALMSAFEQRATPNMKSYYRMQIELARGWIAIAEKRYGDAITAFKAADVTRCTVCALGPLAHAYDLNNQPDSAIAVFERYLSTNNFARAFQDQIFLAGTYKRLGELYDTKGNVEKARLYYTQFVDLWKNADPELQPKVAQVRQRLATLRAREPKG
jgi:serine/threonine-protein kinase